mgnify:CR=1 FL=1
MVQVITINRDGSNEVETRMMGPERVVTGRGQHNEIEHIWRERIYTSVTSATGQVTNSASERVTPRGKTIEKIPYGGMNPQDMRMDINQQEQETMRRLQEMRRRQNR